MPAKWLQTRNTLSCGGLRGEHLKETNQYFDGINLRRSVSESVFSTHAESGYTGVTKKRGKWKTYIRYKGRNYSLGSYTVLEDTIKAGSRGKAIVAYRQASRTEVILQG